jgi:hypothetical protein
MSRGLWRIQRELEAIFDTQQIVDQPIRLEICAWLSMAKTIRGIEWQCCAG